MTDNANSITKKIILKVFRENEHIFINFINGILLSNKKNVVTHIEFLFLNEEETVESLYVKCTNKILKNFFLSFSIISNLENIHQIENQLIKEAKNKFIKVIYSSKKGKEAMPDNIYDDSITNESVIGENIVQEKILNESIENESIENEITINEKIVKGDKVKENNVKEDIVKEDIVKEDIVKEDIINENKINGKSINKNDFKMIFILNDSTNKINYNRYSLIEDQFLDIIEINLAAFNAEEYYKKKGKRYLRLFQNLYLNINMANRSINYSEELMKDPVMAEIIEKVEKELEKLVDQQIKLNEEPIIISDEEYENDLNEDKIEKININRTMIRSNSKRIEVIEEKMNDLLSDYNNDIIKLNALEKNIKKYKSDFDKFKVNINNSYKKILDLLKEIKTEVEFDYNNNKGEIDQLRSYYKRMRSDYKIQREKDKNSMIALKLKIEEVINQQNLQQDIQNEFLLNKLNEERPEFSPEFPQKRQFKYNFDDILDDSSFEETKLKINNEQQGYTSETLDNKEKCQQENSNEQPDNLNEQSNILNEPTNIINKQSSILNKQQNISNTSNDEAFISQKNNSRNNLKEQKETIHLEYPIKTNIISDIQQNNQASDDHYSKSKTQQDIQLDSQQGLQLDTQQGLQVDTQQGLQVDTQQGLQVDTQQGSQLSSQTGNQPVIQEYPQIDSQLNSQQLSSYQEINQENQQLNIQLNVKSKVQQKLKRTKRNILLQNEVKPKKERKSKRTKRQKTQLN